MGSRLTWTAELLEAAGPSSELNAIAQTILKDSKPVRIVSFNKTSEVNWSLPWHQDRVIAVKNKHENLGFTKWSRKSEKWHCEPPAEILERMIFARIHLDHSNETNGCLEISAGSHKLGKLRSKDIGDMIVNLPIETCVAERGDVLFVKALTVHRSATSRSSSSRNAIRIDFSNSDLPPPLEWHY